jgi:hypothetical protein
MADEMQGADPFADIDPGMKSGAPGAPQGDDPFADLNLPDVSTESSGVGAFLSHAARGVLPTGGGLAAAGAGAELGASAGGLVGGPLGAAAGGLIGGVGGFFAGSAAVNAAQDWALHKMPDSWQEAIGQSDREQRLQEARHPIYSFLGGIAPYAVTMTPGAFTTKALNLPANATTFQRLMANPITQRLFGGAAMGGMELGQEEAGGQSPDWAKVAISTGFGLIFNKPTRLGEYLTNQGESAANAALAPVRGAAFGAYMLRAPTRVPPEGVLNPLEPTVAQGADLGVIGPGITESTFRGGEEQSDATKTTAQNAAADEQATLGALPTPDIAPIARRMAPELFAQNDDLVQRRDSLRQFIDAESNPPPEAFDELADRQSAAEEALRNATPRSPDAARYRAELTGIEAERADLARRQEAWANGEHVDSPAVAMARQHLLDTEHQLWDLGPQVSAAMRRAADHVGQGEEAPGEAGGAAPAEPTGASPEVVGTASVPPPAAGTVRVYHGWKEGAPPDSGGSRWVTTDPIYARDFRGGGTPNNVSYVDVPKGHPSEVAARAWEEGDEHLGGNMVGRYNHFEVPEDIAKGFKPYSTEVTGTLPEGVTSEVKPATPPIDILADVSAKLQAAERSKEEADAAGAIVKAYYETRAARFGGAKGSAEDLYQAEGPDIQAGRELATARAPEYAQKGRELEQSAYHGSPHIFDKFSLDKIGTGEGAQVYGHGLYFAGNKAVAKYYREALTGDLDDVASRAKKALGIDVSNTYARRIRSAAQAAGDAKHAAATIARRIPALQEFARKGIFFRSKLERLVEDIRARQPGGRLYHVDIPDDHEYLDWDKPVSEQPNVAATIEKLPEAVRNGISHGEEARGRPNFTGRDLYNAMSDHLGPVEASKTLNEAGIPGLRYLDEGSRADGEGTHNYVVFDDSRINIREYEQGAQGKIRLGDGRAVITLMESANASTFMHEAGHQWLEDMMGDAEDERAPEQLQKDAQTVHDWLGTKKGETIPRRKHEKFARGFEQYLREGVAPSPGLARVFAKFKSWLTTIYQTIKGLGAPINEDIRGVFDRLLSQEPQRTVYTAERETALDIASTHEADAAKTEPHEAPMVADRIAGERTKYVEAQRPDVANELATAEPPAQAAEGAGGAADRGTEASVGATGIDALAGDRGQSEPVAGSGVGGAERGSLDGGGNSTEAKGAGVPGGTRGEPASAGNERSGSGATSESSAFAPKPAADFADAGDTRSVDLAGNIRVENLTDQESVAQAIHDSAERNGDFNAVRGGMTKGQMLDLADSMGLDPEKLDEKTLARMFGGTQDLGAKILAARRLVVQSAGIVSDLMKTAAESGSDADVAQLGVAIARHDMIQSMLAGVTAEWGRAGNAFHSLLTGWEKAQDLNQLLRDNLGRDLYQLKMIAKLGKQLDTPGKVSKFLRDAQKRTFGRMLLEYWINGLISGIATHVTYAVGNTTLAAEKAGPETAAAWAIGAIQSARGRTGERVRLGEVGAQFRGAVRELPASVQAALEAYRTGQTTLLPGETARPLMPFRGDTDLTLAQNMTNAPVSWADVKADAFGLIQGMRDGLVASSDLVQAGGVQGAPLLGWQYSPLGQIPDLAYRGVNVLPLGTLARLPSRNVAAIHSTFRAMNYSMEINALAFRKAAEEADAANLTGSAREMQMAARAADLRQNPSEEMMERARGRATDLTLMGQGGEFVKRLSALTNVEIGGFAPLKFIDPFVHIASNVMDQALIQRTPIGLLSKEIRADLSGANGNIAQDTAAAKMLAGSALAITFGGLASQGLISGSGPADPNKSAMWRLAGNQAHSVRIGDIWYDVHRLGPMGMLMSVSADLYDVAHQIGTEDADTVGKSLMHAFTQNILDESFMRGPADLIKALTDSDRYGASYVRNFMASFMPYSVAMSQMARATDPYSRQARTLMDAVRAKTPGLSEALFPRRDIWGEPMPNGDALGAAGLTAIYESRMSNDPVNLAMLNLGIAPAPVERTIRNVKLTDVQYDDFARLAGRSAKMRLDAIVRSPDFQTWPASTRYEVMKETITQQREAARGVMMGKLYREIPREAAKQRVARITGQPAN